MSLAHRDPPDTVRVLDEDGRIRDGIDPPELSDDALVAMYRTMRLGRRFDERAVKLQRGGRIGTYPPSSGQEGAQVGSAFALRDDDLVVPSYREHLVLAHRGIRLSRILRYWAGDMRGNATLGDAGIFPISVPIATQIPHAAGMAWAEKRRGGDGAVVCYFGDGATSEGDFHEGMNFAGVFDVPAVFFCNNNQYAISVPRERQTASQTLAQKAHAYGFEGVVVDGMDPLAVYAVTERALERARDPPEGRLRPTMIEAVQYRYGAHTTADDPSKYRDDAELERWKERDPIRRLERHLERAGLLDEERKDAIESEIEEELEVAVEELESVEPADPTDVLDHVYAEPTPELERQRERMLERLDGDGGAPSGGAEDESAGDVADGGPADDGAGGDAP